MEWERLSVDSVRPKLDIRQEMGLERTRQRYSCAQERASPKPDITRQRERTRVFCTKEKDKQRPSQHGRRHVK
eukprot:12883243-Prorocentrum_lima.AAC.1